jgi:hypothetical protein
MSQVEYVGHLITPEGITFTRKRIDGVLEIPLPETQKGLKNSWE